LHNLSILADALDISHHNIKTHPEGATSLSMSFESLNVRDEGSLRGEFMLVIRYAIVATN